MVDGCRSNLGRGLGKLVPGAGDATRVLILHRLATARRPMTVGEVVAAVDVGQSTVSHHLKLLADTGFVHVRAARHRPPVPGQRALPRGVPLGGRGRDGSAAPLRPEPGGVRSPLADATRRPRPIPPAQRAGATGRGRNR